MLPPTEACLTALARMARADDTRPAGGTVDAAIPPGVSSLKRGAAAPPSKWPTKVRRRPPTSSCHEM